MNNNLEYNEIKNDILRISNIKKIDFENDFFILLKELNEIYLNEDVRTRPVDDNGLPGGIIYLKNNISTVIIPDIHARVEFLLMVIFYKINSTSILEMLINNEVQIVAVGDGMHSEGRAAKRWLKAFYEYEEDYKYHENIDQEILESFITMNIIFYLKRKFQDNFHYLKGNHDNIQNNYSHGNYPFRKYSLEGEMIKKYLNIFTSQDFIDEFSKVEYNYPLLAIGKNFIISHAEPSRFFDYSGVLNYRNNGEVVRGLTWTSNDQSEDGTVEKMLNYYLKDNTGKTYYFGGHRPVSNLFNLRANGNYVQVNHPDNYVIIYIDCTKEIDLKSDIFELKKNKEIYGL